MNKVGRGKVEEAKSLLQQAVDILGPLQEEEQEKFDNLSEGLQQSERGQQFESNASALDNAKSSVESAIEELDSVE